MVDNYQVAREAWSQSSPSTQPQESIQLMAKFTVESLQMWQFAPNRSDRDLVLT